MLRYTFSGTEVLLGLGGLCLLLAAGIFIMRHYLRGRQQTAHRVFGYTPAIYRVSLCAAIFSSFLAINFTQWEAAPDFTSGPLIMEDIEVVMPITYQLPKPPPPPPPLVIEPVPEPEAESVDMVDQSVTAQDAVLPKMPEVLMPNRPSLPPPIMATPLPPKDPDIVEIWVERMPVFGEDCKQLSGEERKMCSDRALLTFVQRGLQYPALARENGIEGTVVVKFVVEKDGTLSSIEAVRTLGGGCTEAAVKAIGRINVIGQKFTPGIQGGKPVRVAFNLPVKFQLD